jgi:hypothetical protein
VSEWLASLLIVIAWANGVAAGWLWFSPNAPKTRKELVDGYKQIFGIK